jgi:pSer/pThr/pTyr-binding forkhead associated (FHA) protein
MTVPPEGPGQGPDERSGPLPNQSAGTPADSGFGPDTTLTFSAVAPVEPAEAAEGWLAPADQAAVDALPAGSALLVVQRGPNTGARFLLDADRTTAGRRPESDIFLDDVTVSRKHAEFIRRQGQFVVRDVGSLNGTYVHRDRIDEVVLRPGDEVQIGKYRLVFYPSPRGTGAGAGW